MAMQTEQFPNHHDGISLLSALGKRRDEQFTEYYVEIEFVTAVIGGQPVRIETALAMLAARLKKGYITQAEHDALVPQILERYKEFPDPLRALTGIDEMPVVNHEDEHSDEDDDEEELSQHEAKSAAVRMAEEARHTTFWCDTRGRYLESRVVKSAFRDLYSTMSLYTTKNRKKGAHNDGSYVIAADGNSMDRLYFRRNGEILQDVDKTETKVIILKGRSALRVVDLFKGRDDGFETRLAFKYLTHANCSITEQDFIDGLALLEHRGIGSMASQGHGKFRTVDVRKLKAGVSHKPKTDEPKAKKQ
jgi:hypothetical protein